MVAIYLPISILDILKLLQVMFRLAHMHLNVSVFSLIMLESRKAALFLSIMYFGCT